TNAIFANAQLELLSAVEGLLGIQANAADRVAYIRELDQTLAQRHHSHLRYPPRFLVQATAFALKGHKIDVAARLAWTSGAKPLPRSSVAKIEAQFLRSLTEPPEARAGVHSGLQELRSLDCTIVVVTEASRSRVSGTLA